MPDPINCVIDTDTTGGIMCDGTKVILRTHACRPSSSGAGQHGIEDEPSAGIAKIHGTNVIGEGHAWVSASHARYDVVGRSNVWRFILNVARQAESAILRRVSLSFLPMNFPAAGTIATATSNVIEWIGEMREMREIDGIELRMPLRYSSDAAEVVPKGIGTRSYSSGVAQFESVNASVDAGAWFIERHDDFLYNSTGIYNSTDNSTTTIDDGTIVATIGMALSGKVGSTTGPFEGPLMCQDFAGNPTAACRVNPMARIYGSDMDMV